MSDDNENGDDNILTLVRSQDGEMVALDEERYTDEQMFIQDSSVAIFQGLLFQQGEIPSDIELASPTAVGLISNSIDHAELMWKLLKGRGHA